MRRRHAVLLAVALVQVGTLACGDRTAPTEPARPVFGAGAEEVLSESLSGRWSGTITFHPVGGDAQGFQCDGSATISVVLDEEGSSLTGRFRTPCAADVALRGVVQGSFLSGSLDVVGGTSLGRISGSVASSRIAFKTWTTLGDDGTHKGEPPVISSEVELHRQENLARTSPTLAGGGRRPRVLVSR